MLGARISRAILGAGLAWAASGCAEAGDDVRPTIAGAELRVDSSGRLIGTVEGRYESQGQGRLTIQQPELQLVTPDRTVGGAELTFPKRFDPAFDPGETEHVTFQVDDDGGWQTFCDVALQAELQHQTVDGSDKIIVSLGAQTSIRLSCNDR